MVPVQRRLLTRKIFREKPERNSVHLLVNQIQHIPMDAGLSSIVWCSVADPYAVMMTADGSVILLEFSKDNTGPKLTVSRPDISQVCP